MTVKLHIQIFYGREQVIVRARAIASIFGRRNSQRGRTQGAPLPDSGSFTRSCLNSMQLLRLRAGYVDLSRIKSTQFSFFWTHILDFAHVSSPSLMGYGQFTDLQRSLFIFRFSMGESKGLSGSEQSRPYSAAAIANGGAHKGRPYRMKAAS